MLRQLKAAAPACAALQQQQQQQQQHVDEISREMRGE
jgi:hypothetical protein